MSNTHQLPGLLDGAGASKEEWKSDIIAAMAKWKAAIEDIWPFLTINFVAADNSADGYELPNNVLSTDTYSLPHAKGIGDIRFGQHDGDEFITNPNAAAFSAYPAGTTLGSEGNVGGDIHFKFREVGCDGYCEDFRADNNTIPDNTTRPSIAHLAAHELGHSLGLGHHKDEDALMFVSMVASDNLEAIPAKDKTCLQTLYEAVAPEELDTTGWHTDCNTDGNAGSRWESIATKVAAGAPATITITYSFYPSRSTVSVLQNGGPADETNCCICCGRKLPWSYDAGEKMAWGDSCYNGCCACTTVESLSFNIHSCVTISADERFSSNPTLRPCQNDSNEMDFTMTRKVDECYKTQRYANNPEETQAEREEKFIEWLFPPSTPPTLTNSQACQVVENTDPPVPIPNWDTAYTDEDKKNLTDYPEAWGFEGTICAEEHATPNRPGYSYPGDCKGQAIIASLCCCKTKPFSEVKAGGNDYYDACADFDQDQWKKGSDLNTSALSPPYNVVPDPELDDLKAQGECSLGCFTFTIQPNHIYEHKYQALTNEVTVENPYGDWSLVEQSKWSSCSPCVYKQGECQGPCMGLDSKFNPSIVGDEGILMDVGTMIPLNNANIQALQFPSTANTVWNGQHFIIGGQCNDGKDGNQKMRLIVCGAYLTHCDCQQGDYDDCNFGSSSACYGNVQHPGNQPIPCWEDTAGCDECLEKHVPDVNNPYDDLGGVGMRLIYGASFPCVRGFGPPGAPDYRVFPYPCGTMEERRFGGPSAGALGWRQTPETDPEDWNTEGTVEEGYSRTKPFGGNEIWFYGGRDKKGTHPTENEEIDYHYWAWLYCAEDAENEESCGSLCEHVDPVIMWYTGIIEES